MALCVASVDVRMVRYSMVRCDEVQFGMVLYATIWNGTYLYNGSVSHSVTVLEHL